MNKKLVAFLLSTGILVSTCGTVFANEVTLDPPVETVNTPAPPINTTEAPQVTEEPTEEEKPEEKQEIKDNWAEQMAQLVKDVDNSMNKLQKITKDLQEMNGMKINNLEDYANATIKFTDLSMAGHKEEFNLQELLKKANKLNAGYAIDIKPKIKKLTDEFLITHSETNSYIIDNMPNLADEITQDIPTNPLDKEETQVGTQEPIDFVNNNPVNAGNNVGENTVGENNKGETPKPEEPNKEETKDEETKDEETKVNEMAETLKALCKNLDNNNMKVELRKNALECKEALEKLTKSIKTTSQSDNNKKMNAIKDEYTEKKNNIYDKYTKQYKQILNKLSENVKNGTVMHDEVKECYDILNKYERQMKADKDTADKELDNLFKEYETIMDKAYEGMNKATSTVSESGSKMGSSSGSSTSYSSTGTENPKTGDINSLGAGIMGIITSIGTLIVARRKL